MRQKRFRSALAWFFGSAVPLCGLLFAFASAASATEAPTAPPVPRIGVVNTEKVLENLLSWQAAQAELRGREKAAEEELNKQKKEIDRIRAELDYFNPGSRDHEKRVAELAERQSKLQRDVGRVREELADASRRALESAAAQIREAVKDFAIANKFDIVADARAVFYAASGADISLEIARTMNKQYKKEAPKGN